MDSHYNNKKGSIYRFATDQELNAYESDIIKRVVRCRRKGEFLEDLHKTKRVIDLYIKEFENPDDVYVNWGNGRKVAVNSKNKDNR